MAALAVAASDVDEPDVPSPSWAIRSSDRFRWCVGESGNGTAEILNFEDVVERGEVFMTVAACLAAAGGDMGVAVNIVCPMPAVAELSLRSDDVEGREGVIEYVELRAPGWLELAACELVAALADASAESWSIRARSARSAFSTRIRSS